MSGRRNAQRVDRALRRLAQRGANPTDVNDDMAKELLARGLVESSDGRLALTAAGRSYLRRRLSSGDGFGDQHRTLAPKTLDEAGGGRQTIVVNLDESPLARLRRMKGRDGQRLIGDAEFAAGERLRADFERAQLMPRVTANWSAAVASGRRGGAGMADIADSAIEARRRIDRATTAIGPEFAGVLIDFCCFLKGVEEIEKQRAWPVRSAKLVVRLALTSLARHYGISETASGAPSRKVSHWGTADFRPSLKGEV